MPYDRNDYIILMDENGTPYIAHGWISDTAQKIKNKATGMLKNPDGTWKTHKYVAKAKKAGQTIYFYTNEAYQAFLRNSGIGGKGRIEKERQELGEAQDKATLAKIKNDQQQARYRNDKNSDRAARNEAWRNNAKAQQQVRKEQADVDRAIDEYDRSWLGRAESTFSKAKNAKNNAVANTKGAFERMKGEFAEKKDQAKETIDKGREKINSMTGAALKSMPELSKAEMKEIAQKIKNGVNVSKAQLQAYYDQLYSMFDK